MQKILIVGLGLIGGSVAKALKRNGTVEVIGFDNNEIITQKALSDKAVDGIWDGESVTDADLTVVCLSPVNTVQFLNNKGSLIKPNSVVTDVCGVKKWIVANVLPIAEKYGFKFVGGHPMAGREVSGYINSMADLFDGASYIITPTKDTEATQKVVDFAKKLGISEVTLTTPEKHDNIIAFTSQIPHVLAGSYVKSPYCREHRGYSAGSYKDVSRVATVDEKLWSELFILNKESLCNEIDCLIENLNSYKKAIMAEDDRALKTIIRNSRIIKEADNRK